MKRQDEHREVVGEVGRVDVGGVHLAHVDVRVPAQLARGDIRHRDWVDIRNRRPGGGAHFQELARQPTVARTQFQDLRLGNIGNELQCALGDVLVIS